MTAGAKVEQQPVHGAQSSSNRTSGLSRALLLYQKFSSDDRNLTELLDFFGIPWTAVKTDEITGDSALPEMVDRSNFCILSSATCMAEVIRGTGDSAGRLPDWMKPACSVYIHGFHDTGPCKSVLRFLTNDPQANIHRMNVEQVVMSVTGKLPEMCGPLSGLQVPVQLSEQDCVFDLQGCGEQFQSIIRAKDGEVFCASTCSGVRFYLNASCTTVDISAHSAKFFDVKECFASAVPITMYLKWAFRDICWTGAETSACLIVDDPPLKPRYGFLRFRETLELMDAHNFTTTIAFIPWNWKRTARSTVDMFQTRPDRLSLSIHGCDHTAAEFASRSAALLDRRIKTAGDRMELLLRRSSLPYDRVMVFPQGQFSPEAARALKLNNFVAAVNTEVAPSGNAANNTTIADLWQVAIMKYGSFPIFTRRYLTHGIENFAFDALLGKPCLLVGHHDIFREHGRELVNFIGKLNSLRWILRWRPLGAALNHSFKARTSTDGTHSIQMYGNSLVFENSSSETREAAFFKEENDPGRVKAVMVDQSATTYSCEGGHLQFTVQVPPQRSAQVRILYSDKADMDLSADSIGYGLKTRTRRYLSEFRDNYLSRNAFLHQTAIRMKAMLR